MCYEKEYNSRLQKLPVPTIVTGGAGFIGSHLAEALRDAVVVDDLSAGKKENWPGKIVQESVTDADAMVRALRGADVVYHFAAMPDVRENEEKPALAFDVNVRGTVNVLEACRKNDARHVVFASSSVVYGEASAADESAALQPQSRYAASKVAAEGYLSAYVAVYGMKATVLRYANIYGPRSRRGVMHDFAAKLNANPRKLEILGDGKQTKSYVFVSDAVRATLLAAKKQRTRFEAFNVAAAPVTVRQVAELVAGALGLNPKFEFTGGRAGWAGDVPIAVMDAEKLRRLGWEPAIGLQDGVKTYVDWLQRVHG